MDLFQQLGDLQLRLVKQLPPLAALDVYKALAALRLTPSDDIHDVIFNALVHHMDDLTVAQISSFLQVQSCLVLWVRCASGKVPAET